MKEGWNVILRYDASFAGVNVWLIHKTGSKEVVVDPVDLTMTSHLEPDYEYPEPTLRFNGTAAHQFMTDLAQGIIEAGFRPEVLKSSDKEVAAIKDHLEDMRRIVFEKLLKK